MVEQVSERSASAQPGGVGASGHQRALWRWILVPVYLLVGALLAAHGWQRGGLSAALAALFALAVVALCVEQVKPPRVVWQGLTRAQVLGMVATALGCAMALLQR